MALTKGVSVLQDWTVVTGGVVAEGPTIDVSTHYQTTLYIMQALIEAAVHDGTVFIIQASSTAADDEDWHTIGELNGPTGTSNTEPITNAPAAIGTTVFTVASTVGYTVNGEWRFIYEAAAPEDSELILQSATVGNTSITAIDGSAVAHVATTPLWSIAASFSRDVDTFTKQRLRVLVMNDLTNDANIAWRLSESHATSV